MNACMIVYSSIFILMLIPMAFLLVRNARDKKNRKKGVRNACLLGATIVLFTALCATLYGVTINRQSILVIERVVRAVHEEGAESLAGLSEKHLLAKEAAAQDAQDAILAGSMFSLGNKTLQSEEGRPVHKLRVGEDIIILVEMEETPSQATVVSMVLVASEEAAQYQKADQFTVLVKWE